MTTLVSSCGGIEPNGVGKTGKSVNRGRGGKAREGLND